MTQLLSETAEIGFGDLQEAIELEYSPKGGITQRKKYFTSNINQVAEKPASISCTSDRFWRFIRGNNIIISTQRKNNPAQRKYFTSNRDQVVGKISNYSGCNFKQQRKQ